LSALAAAVPQARELKWLVGAVSVRPEIGNDLSTAHWFTSFQQYVQFYLPCPTRRVFIVHGRDRRVRDMVENLLRRLELEPVILEEFHPQSLVLLDKFEKYSDVGFALILMTGDDVGALNLDGDEMHPRARQNVVLELGYFLGTLGRERVAVLLDDGVEIPSDIHGVEYIPFATEEWRAKVCGALEAAGLRVDQSRLYPIG